MGPWAAQEAHNGMLNTEPENWCECMQAYSEPQTGEQQRLADFVNPAQGQVAADVTEDIGCGQSSDEYSSIDRVAIKLQHGLTMSDAGALLGSRDARSRACSSFLVP